MYKLTISTIRATKARFLFSAAAVALGVAFMAGTLVLTDTIRQAYGAITTSAYEGTDALVRSSRVMEDPKAGPVRGTIDQSVLEAVRHADGVAAAEPQVLGVAQVLASDGDLLDSSENRAIPIALAWQVDPELNPLELVDGRAPAQPDEIVIDRATADAGAYSPGDTVQVITMAGSDSYTVAGIATYGGADDAAGAPVTAFAPETAARVLGEPGHYDLVQVRAVGGVSQAELVANVDAALAGTPDVEAMTGDAFAEAMQTDAAKGMEFMNTFLMSFAIVALLVGSFVISNTFSITIAQRTKETAMLRAIGASRRQIMRAVRLEALLTGMLASVVGAALGVGMALGLRALLESFGIDLPEGGLVVAGSTVALCVVVGTVVTLVASLVPARKAAKVAPIAAMRDVAFDRSGRSVRRAVLGTIVSAAGVALLTMGLGGAGVSAVGGGATLVFLGVAVLGPVIARPVSRMLGAPLPVVRGVTGTIARENATRNPKRTSATASALMVGVGLVVFITVFGASARASIEDTVDTAMEGDWIVDTTFGQGGLDPEVGQSIARLPEVSAVAPVRFSTATVDGAAVSVSAFVPGPMQENVDMAVTSGSVEGMDADDIAIHTDTAETTGLRVGDAVDVQFPDGAPATFSVVAVYDTADPMGTYATTIDAFEANGVDKTDNILFVANVDGVSMDAARTAIEATMADFPTANLLTADEFTQSVGGEINQFLNLVYALLALAVLIALFGIANTLGLSVHERTRELGLLRAVGMARSQVRSAVRLESVIIALLGSALGLGIGLGFAWALVQAMAEQGFSVLAVPVTQLAVIVVLAAAAGVATAILPARKAAKVDVLRALSTA